MTLPLFLGTCDVMWLVFRLSTLNTNTLQIRSTEQLQVTVMFWTKGHFHGICCATQGIPSQGHLSGKTRWLGVTSTHSVWCDGLFGPRFIERGRRIAVCPVPCESPLHFLKKIIWKLAWPYCPIHWVMFSYAFLSISTCPLPSRGPWVFLHALELFGDLTESSINVEIGLSLEGLLAEGALAVLHRVPVVADAGHAEAVATWRGHRIVKHV